MEPFVPPAEPYGHKRVDVAATEKLPMLSRAYVRKLIEDGRITVNKAAAKPGYRLRRHDSLEIDFDPKELDQIDDIDLPIVYEDSDVIVINKPAGVISHARGRFWNEPSVASFVRQKTQLSGERAGIVHRLDRATSGVMIAAKNQAALAWLQQQFADRKTTKTYVAIVTGHLTPEKALIDMPIERDPNHPQTFRTGPQGKPATTVYEVLKATAKLTELQLHPQTGRTHQLRVHLKQIGHPIVGDSLYGGEVAERLFLHAQQLKICLPGKTAPQTFRAAVPPEFAALLEG